MARKRETPEGESPPTAPLQSAQQATGETSDELIERMKRESRNIILKRLLDDPFAPSQIKYKPSVVKNNRCLAMAYIDARVVEDRLDEALGVENWKDEYELLDGGSVLCRLSIRYSGGEWVTKSDVGSPSEQPDKGDRMKAAVSDALKRAAVKFGIGRYLYRLTSGWVDYDPVKKRIVGTPTLPDWARPRIVKDAPVYHDDDYPSDPATQNATAQAAAATSPPPPTPVQPPHKAAEDEAARKRAIIDERLKWWLHEMSGCEGVVDLTNLVRDNLGSEPGFAKGDIWGFIQKQAADVDWKWNKDMKEFYTAQKAGEAILF